MVLVQDNLWDLFSIKTNNISAAVKIWLGEKDKRRPSGAVVIVWFGLYYFLAVIEMYPWYHQTASSKRGVR